MLHIDFETRGTLDLREVGLYNYARHPLTAAWCMAFALDDEPVRVTAGKFELPDNVRDCVARGGTVIAHNAPFELEIWEQIMVPRYGWPVLRADQTYCTMAAAYAMALPGGLEDAAAAMGLPVRKDLEGRKLMLKMARPRSVALDGTPTWWDAPELQARLHAYCAQDVEVERELHKRLIPLGQRERRVWLMDYRINRRGFAIDAASVHAGVELAEHVKARADAKLTEITGGRVTKHTALLPLKQWVAERTGWEIDSLDKDAVAERLEGDMPADVRTALLLRQEAGKASTAKLATMLTVAGPDARVRNAFQYHGAGTGRWAGRKVQPHNFIRDVPKPEDAERILRWAGEKRYGLIELYYGMPLSALSRCMRPMIVAAPGKVLNGGDYSAIEGRGTAWIAGEWWKLDAFRAADAGTSPDIYKISYARAFGVSPESVLNPSRERQVGKVQELAFGYQGGAGAWMTMAKGYRLKTDTAEGERNKTLWRAAHLRTVSSWKGLERAAIAAVRTPGTITEFGQNPDAPIKFRTAGSFLWCLLPSGRALCYPYPKILEGEYGPKLTYMAVPAEGATRKGKTIADPTSGPRWVRVNTYGGSLLENVVQAICRDILADAMLALDDAGFNLVLHVHDDAQSEDDTDRAAEMTRIMSSASPWAKGFPIAIECHAAQKYGFK